MLKLQVFTDPFNDKLAMWHKDRLYGVENSLKMPILEFLRITVKGNGLKVP